MKVLVVGCGNIGSVAASDLAASTSSLDIVVADKDPIRAKAVAEKLGKANVSWSQIDARNHADLINRLKEFNVVLGFLPGNLGYRLTEACIEAKKDLVDVSFMGENPLALHEMAVKAGVTIVPDCGLAPGISNMLVGHAISALDKVQSVHVMVGGLPETPVPPLGYVITWSPESLIDEYMRKARIIAGGRLVEVEALTGMETVDFSNLGKLEAFYTDGLRTLLHTVKGVEDMWEKTLRYPGHADKIMVLKSLGFFEDKPINVQGISVSPQMVTVKLLSSKLAQPEIRDIVALRVVVSGVKKNKPVRYTYELLDFYDKSNGVTAMARTTAYPASLVAQLMLKKIELEKGVVPPEKLGMNKNIFSILLDGLKKHGIEIKETID
ncbi:saccharopine dehydrogenase family protein [Candidatus Bathyarchaeota archaeon]|nr:saccharopine dehydrogenase family protein [Candidatus Bathyarchaeota archaeon]